MLGHILGVKFVDEYLDATDALAAAMTYHNSHHALSFAKGTVKKKKTTTKGKKYSGWDAFVKDNSGRVK